MIRAMEMVEEARGLPGSGQSGPEPEDQGAWAEMEDEDAVRLLTPHPQTPDTGEPAVWLSAESTASAKRGAEGTEICQYIPRLSSQHQGGSFTPGGQRAGNRR